MNTIRLMTFKDEHHVDWKQTQANVTEFINSRSTAETLPSEKAMWSADIMKDLHNWVKRFTVKNCYYTVATINHMIARDKPK